MAASYTEDQDTGCWLLEAHGLAPRTARRAAARDAADIYRRLHGPIPAGRVLVRTCGNPTCVNPDHLLLATTTEAAQRGSAAKLRPAQVRELRALRRSGWTLTRLASRFGLHYSTVSRICRGQRWRNVA